jgi:hypothetical protein
VVEGNNWGGVEAATHFPNGVILGHLKGVDEGLLSARVREPNNRAVGEVGRIRAW